MQYAQKVAKYYTFSPRAYASTCRACNANTQTIKPLKTEPADVPSRAISRASTPKMTNLTHTSRNLTRSSWYPGVAQPDQLLVANVLVTENF